MEKHRLIKKKQGEAMLEKEDYEPGMEVVEKKEEADENQLLPVLG